ncbi:peptidoglycan editing factor PgeF [Lutibacter sp. B2]|nr:peptidoglycan editing factor PgeF [Lutibacter sp. B2]
MGSSFKIQKGENGVVYYSIPTFDKTNLVKTCFTTKIGGVSKGNYSSLNLGIKTDDKKENIIDNFKNVCEATNISIQNLVLSDQVHKDNIRILTKEDRGKGVLYDSDILEVDGFITNEKNVALVNVYADCVSIFLLDRKQKVISLVHSGWKGTVKKIVSKALVMMKEHFGTNPKDCLAAIGPSIGPCCYEVDGKVIDQFKETFEDISDFTLLKDDGKYMLDLWKVNKMILVENGILESNISMSNICTMCNSEKLFSYRKDKGTTGRMVGIIQLL